VVLCGLIVSFVGEWCHIRMLAPGARQIAVTLNADSYDNLSVKGELVSATQEVHVPSK
jgi:hypothetical protein